MPISAPACTLDKPHRTKGRLIVPSREYELPVHLLRREGRVLSLMPEGAAAPLSFASDETVTFEYALTLGVVRKYGEAYVRDDLVEFHVTQAVELLPRRDLAPVPCSVPVLVRALHGRRTQAEAVEVGTRVITVAGVVDAEHADELRFELNLHDGCGRLSGEARILKVREDGRTELCIERISRSDRQRLICFTLRYQRAELAPELAVRGLDALLAPAPRR